MSTLKNSLYVAVKEEIAFLRFYNNNLGVENYTLLRDFLQFCIQHEVITEEQIKVYIRDRILAFGHECGDEHVRSLNGKETVWPDHVFSPHALALALMWGTITEKETRMIKFDHGDTLETFISQYADEKMADRVLAQLFEWKPKEPGPAMLECGCPA